MDRREAVPTAGCRSKRDREVSNHIVIAASRLYLITRLVSLLSALYLPLLFSALQSGTMIRQLIGPKTSCYLIYQGLYKKATRTG